MKKGFTLAEVLITLGIIGVVAALTVPTLMQNADERANIVALKKAYSILSQAYTSAVQENGTPDNWNLIGMGDATGLANLNTIMSKYLNVTKNCDTGSGCFASVGYRDLNGIANQSLNADTGYSKLILADGTSLALRQWTPDCSWDWSGGSGNLALKSVCGYFSVDINGFKKPNQMGVDVFQFLFTKYGLVPLGTPLQNSYTYANYCNRTKTSGSGWYNGSSCTAWVLYNDNMDYLHCNYLDWGGKTKCD